MTSQRTLIPLAVLAGAGLMIVAAVYFVDTASALPGFFPGHEAGSSHHHVKHGIAALVVGAGCFVFAWFRLGPKAGAARVSPSR